MRGVSSIETVIPLSLQSDEISMFQVAVVGLCKDICEIQSDV